MSKDSFDPRFDAAFQPGFIGVTETEPQRSANPAKAALEAARQQAEVAEQSSDGDHDDRDTAPRRVNPFLIALGVLALALIGGGIQGIRTVQSVFNVTTMTPDIDYTTISMVVAASPIAIALGIAIGAGVLFMYAIAWQRKG